METTTIARRSDAWVDRTWPTSLRKIKGEALKNCIMFDLEAGRPVRTTKRRLSPSLSSSFLDLVSSPATHENLDHPMCVGFLLMVFPPIGVALLWSSKRYTHGARMALTLTTLTMMCLATIIATMAILH